MPTTGFTTVPHKMIDKVIKNQQPKQDTAETTTSTATSQEGNLEDYPSAINQGQLFSIIENGIDYNNNNY